MAGHLSVPRHTHASSAKRILDLPEEPLYGQTLIVECNTGIVPVVSPSFGDHVMQPPLCREQRSPSKMSQRAINAANISL